MKKSIRLFFAAAMVAAAVSCDRDESDFAGRDNYIVGFDLTVSGVTYTGAVAGDQILMSVPEGLSLRGAVADVRLSERASITPDPSQITDWASEEQFVVTARDNTRKSYIYRLVRTAVSASGNVTLVTQAEADAFAATGVSVIDGNLTIGSASGATDDPIVNLSGLGALRQVVHRIKINNTYAGEDFDGLANLEKIGGLTVGTAPALTGIHFPKLTTAGTDISIGSTTVIEVRMPELTFVGENFTVKSDALEAVDFGELAAVGGDMTLNGTNAGAQTNTMETVSLPKLETVGGALTMSYWVAAARIDLPALKCVGGMVTLNYWNKIDAMGFPALESAGGLTIGNSSALAGLDLPALKTLRGDMSLSGLNAVASLFVDALTEIDGGLTLALGSATSVSFSVLERVGGTLHIPSSASNLVMPYFPKLKYIGTDLQIQNTAMTDLTGFAALEEIGARLYLHNATGITTLADLVSLKKVGTSYYLYGLTALTELDIRGIAIPEINVYSTTWTGLKIVGDETFDGRLYLSAPPSGITAMPQLSGIKTVRELAIGTGSYAGTVEFGGVEVVTGLLDFTSCNNCPTIRMPDLVQAGGIKFNYNNALTMIDFPKLEQITGERTGIGFSYPATSNIAAIDLPMLKSITGNFTLTGLTAARSALRGVNMPLIERVTGTITLTGTANTGFTDVGNFSNLVSAGGVAISNFTNLTSFAGFGNAVSSLGEGSWKVSGCGYNPTYQHMLDGVYTKP